MGGTGSKTGRRLGCLVVSAEGLGSVGRRDVRVRRRRRPVI